MYFRINMKYLLVLFLYTTLLVNGQELIDTKFVNQVELKADHIVGIDNFGTLFFTKANTIYKKNKTSTISYNNLQLGELSSANSFNPLKINLFYKELNTAVILDNRLAEIFKIDFNAISTYKNVSHISTGYDNTIWIFNQDTRLLEVYDYKTNTTRAKTQHPITSKILTLKSNYNYCYLLTEDYIMVYNYFGSIVEKLKNNGYTDIEENNGFLYLKKENSLYYLGKEKSNIIPIKTKGISINEFFVTNESLYIYNNESLQEFQIKIN